MKKTTSLPLRIAAPLALLTLAGCAAGPRLASYPRRQLDRPYTLPKGIAAWGIPAALVVGQNASQESIFVPPVPVPLLWTQSLADDWQLNWAILPLTVSHQLAYGDWGYAGVTFGFSNIGYSSVNGFYFAPTFGGVIRHKFVPWMALDTGFTVGPEILTGGPSPGWGAVINAWPRFQITDLIDAWAGPSLQFISRVAVGTSAPFTDLVQENGVSAVVPLSVGASWSFARQWDASLRYDYFGIGEPDGVYLHEATAQFTMYW